MTGDTTRDDAHPMTGAELRCLLAALGLGRDQSARLLRMAPRSVERMMYGVRDVPPGIALEVRSWLERADGDLADIRAALERDPDHSVVTFRDDDEYMAAHPGDRMPAAYHRAIVGRVLLERPGTRVAYAAQNAP